MLDIKYWLIKLLQWIVKISNYIQSRFINVKTIKLNWNEKILIIKADRIGDASWTINFINLLKNKFPDIQIDVVCNDYNKFVFDNFDYNLNKIYSININPPLYLIKEIYKIFTMVLEPLKVFFGNIKLRSSIKNNKYDYVLNLTWRNYYMVSCYLWTTVGWWLGILNFLYNFPVIEHNEIWAKDHIIIKWLNIFNLELNNPLKSKRPIKDVLLFIGWKNPNKLSLWLYQKIHQIFLQNWCNVSVLVDEGEKIENFVLTKDKNWLYVGHQKLDEFLVNYDLFVWVDGGILHYASLFMPTLSFYTSTNHMAAYPFWWKLLPIESYWNTLFYVSQDYNHYVISNNVECKGCFQIWCMWKKCWNFIDNEVEIIIKRIIELSLTILK